jgi:hypothetical protein
MHCGVDFPLACGWAMQLKREGDGWFRGKREKAQKIPEIVVGINRNWGIQNTLGVNLESLALPIQPHIFIFH